MDRRIFLGLTLATIVNNKLYANEPILKAGDILLTRNAGGEQFNESPGYYNHTAIFAGGNWVVEAQAIFDKVIAVPVWYFFERYPEILVLRPKDAEIAIRTSSYAHNLIGRNYTKLESIRPLWRWHSGDSCVTVIRRIYNQVTGIDYKWRIPDDFAKSNIFTAIALQKDYENYKRPPEPYKGMIQQLPNWAAKK